jgi:hypothetical protein
MDFQETKEFVQLLRPLGKSIRLRETPMESNAEGSRRHGFRVVAVRTAESGVERKMESSEPKIRVARLCFPSPLSEVVS